MTAPPTPPGTPPERRARVEQVMGLPVSVHLRGLGVRSGRGGEHVARLFAHLRDVDAVFSTYRADSDVSRLGRGEAGLDEVDPRVREVLARCEAWRAATGGYFDVRAGGPGAGLDPSGLVKGWAVESACRALAAGLDDDLDWCVNAGGDVAVGTGPGRPPWRVGVEDPGERGRVLDAVEVSSGAVATSGTAARGAHVLDPTTGLPARGLASVTVVAGALERADVLATAALARGPGAVAWLAGLAGACLLDAGLPGAGGAGVHWLVVAEDGAVDADPAWPGRPGAPALS